MTGGAGFIGSHLTRRLLARGDRVTVLDDFNDFYDPARKRENVAPLLAPQPEYRLVEGDIRDEALVDRLYAEGRFDAVVHLAARAGVRPSLQEPILYEDVNCIGTLRLLEAARRHGPKIFIFGSSSSVYGINEKVPFSESDEVNQPISPYATTKRAGELLCYNYHHLYGFRTACLRFFTVYGPGQRPEMAIHKFTDLLWRGQTVPDVRRRRQPAGLHLRRRHRRRPDGGARARAGLRDPQSGRARRPPRCAISCTGSPRSLPWSPGSTIFRRNPGTSRSPTPTCPRRRGSWVTPRRCPSGKVCAVSSPGTVSAPKRLENSNLSQRA